MKNNRAILIKGVNPHESLKVTWEEFLKYFGGYVSFDELKQKYQEEDRENKKGKIY